MKRRRPDWEADIELEESRRRRLRSRQERNRREKIARGGKTRFEAMSREERDALRDDLLRAHDTITALVEETRSPEFQAAAEAAKADFQGACRDLGEAIVLAQARLAAEFPGVEACVPAYDPETSEEWLIFFDGRRLLWADPPRTNMWQSVVDNAPLRVRTHLCDALQPLRAALVARRWVAGPALCAARTPRANLCTGTPRHTKPLWELQGLPNPRKR